MSAIQVRPSVPTLTLLLLVLLNGAAIGLVHAVVSTAAPSAVWTTALVGLAVGGTTVLLAARNPGPHGRALTNEGVRGWTVVGLAGVVVTLVAGALSAALATWVPLAIAAAILVLLTVAAQPYFARQVRDTTPSE